MASPAIKRDPRTFLGARGFEQADFVMSTWQKFFFALIVLMLVGFLAFGVWWQALWYANTVFAVFFLICTVYRLYLVDVALRERNEIFIVEADLVEPTGGWPTYVVQVPLYHEPHAVPEIVEALSKLDYPPDRLTIQLLLEADDRETLEAVSRQKLEAPFTVVEVPVSHPRTKPKACNVGLAQATGDFLVIYDAEDRPDPDQLKKAVVAFSRSSEGIVCIQAKLNFYNTYRNLITRCFAAEYALWFDLCLPGLDALRAPIPLGGTSNHFRLDVLKELKGWDEFNVTEDCDLGLRLFNRGYQTRILDSTTWEEACPKLGPWFRQRSRWVKGYVQTYFVHTRNFWQLTRDLGVCNSIHFHLLVGGSVLTQLLAPFYWILVLAWILLGWAGGDAHAGVIGQASRLVSSYFPLPVFIMAALCLFLGNFVMVYSSAVACVRRDFHPVVKYTPLMIVYWFLMSLAAWKGVLQLIWKPHYWEKTQHREL